MFPRLEFIRRSLGIKKTVPNCFTTAAMLSIEVDGSIQASFHLLTDLGTKFVKFWLTFQRRKHVPFGCSFAIIRVMDETAAADTIQEHVGRDVIQILGRGEAQV